MRPVPQFEADDLDWALGELYHLAKVAGQRGILPHEYDPALFHTCFSFITAQPLPIAIQLRSTLLDLTRFWYYRSHRRYAYAHA